MTFLIFLKTMALRRDSTILRDIPQLENSSSGRNLALMTARYEGMPNVLMEALALGCPTIATEAGAVAEVLNHGQCGALIPPDNKHRLFERLIELISNDELRLNYSIRERNHIQKSFSLENMLEKTAQAYVTALKQKASLS